MIVPGVRNTAYVVDLGDEAREKLAGYAVSRSAEHTVDAGHAVLRFLRPAKLARRQPIHTTGNVHHLLSALESSDPAERPHAGILADAIGDVTGDPDDPRATVVRMHGEQRYTHTGVQSIVRPAGAPAAGLVVPPIRSTTAFPTSDLGGLSLGVHQTLYPAEPKRVAVAQWAIPTTTRMHHARTYRDYHRFHAVLTSEQAHALADKLPAIHRKAWHAWIDEHIDRAPLSGPQGVIRFSRPSDTPSMLEQLRQHAQAAVNTSNPKKAGIHRTIADMLHTRLAKQGITAPHPSTFTRE